MTRIRLKKRSTIGHRETPFSHQPIHKSLLQRTISPSRNFGVNCRTEGFAFRNLTEAKTTFYSWGYR